MEVEESSKGSQKEAKGKKTTLETKIRQMTVIKNPEAVIYLFTTKQKGSLVHENTPIVRSGEVDRVERLFFP